MASKKIPRKSIRAFLNNPTMETLDRIEPWDCQRVMCRPKDCPFFKEGFMTCITVYQILPLSKGLADRGTDLAEFYIYLTEAVAKLDVLSQKGGVEYRSPEVP